MRHAGHTHDHAAHSLNALALAATVHCLTGCAIGEVLGMVLGTALGWSNGATLVASILLAFLFGYALTSLPLVRSGMPIRQSRAAGLRVGHALDHDHGDRRHGDRGADPGSARRRARRIRSSGAASRSRSRLPVWSRTRSTAG